MATEPTLRGCSVCGKLHREGSKIAKKHLQETLWSIRNAYFWAR